MSKPCPLLRVGCLVESLSTSILRLHTGCRNGIDVFVGFTVDHGYYVQYNGRYFELSESCLMRLAEECGLFENEVNHE